MAEQCKECCEADHSDEWGDPAQRLAGVIISQFLLYMQNENIWPVRIFSGDSLTGDEVIALKDSFKKLMIR